MTSQNLANLAKIGKLKAEPGNQKEFDGLVRSARFRLADARMNSLSIESRSTFWESTFDRLEGQV